VGVATVAAFGIWYLFPSFLGIDLTGDGHTIISFGQLSSWGTCPAWPDFNPAPYTAGPLTIAMQNPCDYFTTGKVRLGAMRSWQLNLAESRPTAWVVGSLWEMQRHEWRVMNYICWPSSSRVVFLSYSVSCHRPRLCSSTDQIAVPLGFEYAISESKLDVESKGGSPPSRSIYISLHATSEFSHIKVSPRFSSFR
jgi:hypothetical protein